MVFEVIGSKESYTFKKFLKAAACFYYYHKNFLISPVSIWDNYYLQRSAFINSINFDETSLRAKHDELKVMECILFTSAK
jgi:hypothetical protein